MCSVSIDYTGVTGRLSRHGSVHKPDEMFLLPHEQVVHNTSVDSNVECSAGDGLFDELDQLVHVDTDMSSLLQAMLVQHSHISGASDDVSGQSLVDTEQASQNSERVSETRDHHPDIHYHCDDDQISQSFHEYDPVYVPHNDAEAMARRIDNETSYVRTLQPRHDFSPYEEVHFGVRPLLLSDQPPAQVYQQPVVPPRTSSILDSHFQNSASNRMVADYVDKGQTDGTDLHGDLSHQTSTSSDVDVDDAPYESVVVCPVGYNVHGSCST